ncbi:hypothetical protein [Lactococcus cremoris]|uniref:hypothetical protein n=1 Tax=Lactococcus lactis subsp. cremoris TaxID=1359 RepID=UPI001C27D748|nr:hypothetical protein [Lactococcus cremoris]MBU8904841.1 hypothetical protein [Lactococcus cremoris]MCT0488417.1 hypothetical protein [Lactococcus cremoris]MCT4454818.1 hypothetical protein [Lactococcus cremoris]
MIPKLVKAEMMPNLRLKLFFDNKEIRFLGTNSSKHFIEKNSILKNMFSAWGASLSSLSGTGQSLEIAKDGSLSIENHTLSAKDVYELSVPNLSELKI